MSQPMLNGIWNSCCLRQKVLSDDFWLQLEILLLCYEKFGVLFAVMVTKSISKLVQVCDLEVSLCVIFILWFFVLVGHCISPFLVAFDCCYLCHLVFFSIDPHDNYHASFSICSKTIVILMTNNPYLTGFFFCLQYHP